MIAKDTRILNVSLPSHLYDRLHYIARDGGMTLRDVVVAYLQAGCDLTSTDNSIPLEPIAARSRHVPPDKGLYLNQWLSTLVDRPKTPSGLYSAYRGYLATAKGDDVRPMQRRKVLDRCYEVGIFPTDFGEVQELTDFVLLDLAMWAGVVQNPPQLAGMYKTYHAWAKLSDGGPVNEATYRWWAAWWLREGSKGG